MKRTVSRMGHSSLQRHFFNIGVKVFSSRRCFSVGGGVVGKGVGRKTIREKHIEVDFTFLNTIQKEKMFLLIIKIFNKFFAFCSAILSFSKLLRTDKTCYKRF